MVKLHHQPFGCAVEIRDFLEGPPLAPLRPLSVACMKQRNIPRAMPFARNGRADAGVHSPAQQHDRFSRFTHLLFFSLLRYVLALCLAFFKLPSSPDPK